MQERIKEQKRHMPVDHNVRYPKENNLPSIPNPSL